MTVANVQGAAGWSASSRAPVQTVALGVGGVFLLVGIMGFVPGVVTNHDQFIFASHLPGAALLGSFTVSVVHNTVHVAFGVVGVLLARTFTTARTYLMGSGVFYLVLFIIGAVVNQDGAMNLPINGNDNWLHLGLAVGMLLLGAVLGGPEPRRSPLAISVTSPLNQASGQ